MERQPTNYRRLLAKYIRPQLPQASLLAALLLSTIALKLVNPQILKAFIDAAQSAASADTVGKAALAFIGIALVQQGLSIPATYLSERVGWTATNALRIDLFSHLLHMDLGFHKEHTPGELIERVDGDVTSMANFFSQFVIQILGSGLLLIGIVIAVWFTDWRAGLAFAVFAVAALGAMIRLRSIAVPFWAASRQASATLFGFIEERLGGTEDIRSSGARAYVMRRLLEFTRARLKTNSKARLVGAVGWTLPNAFGALGTAGAFVLSSVLYNQGTLTLGAAFLIFYYLQAALQPLNMIAFQIDDFQRASAGLLRVRELLQRQSLLNFGPTELAQPAAMDVTFDHVSFSYDSGDAVLHDLTFTVPAGKALGLLGRTGSGKTTIARLLCRLYDPTEGAICIGDVYLRDMSRESLRQRIALVTQDVQLFQASVRDNVTFFDRSIADERILAAFDQLGLAAWSQSLERGLDTLLGPNGSGLSAGEAQLLALARVLLRNPSVVILDEASSRLDPVTERLIERAIAALLRNRTAIIIAHRLTTITRADDILILEHGDIAEYGPRLDLLNNPSSRLAALFRLEAKEVLV